MFYRDGTLTIEMMKVHIENTKLCTIYVFADTWKIQIMEMYVQCENLNDNGTYKTVFFNVNCTCVFDPNCTRPLYEYTVRDVIYY